MIVRNTTLAYFDDVCDRRDAAIRVSQSNDDGQFPVTTSNIEKVNISDKNIVFNGLPNLNMVTPRDCGGKPHTTHPCPVSLSFLSIDMDCDGLKKNLLRDTDGSLFGHIGAAISHAEALWGE